MKIVKKNKEKSCCCVNAEKCCSDVEWSVGYLIGETISCIVSICVHFINNATKGYDSRGKTKKPNYAKRASL
jgi:putative flippase GtrA